MTSFDEREKAFEAKYNQDQQLQFKVMVRRNKLLGLWAAELLGLADDAAETYAKSVVSADFDRPGDDDVLEKVLGDLQEKRADITEHRVRHEMERLMETAKAQVQKEI